MTDIERQRRAIRLWLAIVALLIAVMVLVGGATRLTESGLSIVEWKPVTGALPPLSESAWQAAFEKYQLIPQYRQINLGMSLAEFKTIYWWEWTHRQLGRLIGLAFLLPLLVFWWKGWLEPRLKPRLLGLLALGAAQGAIGWWMVASGLVERTDVSQIRLAVHLTLACVILSATLALWQSLRPQRDRVILGRGSRWVAYCLLGLVLLQIFLGALVAGLNAGMIYNTWPLMDGAFIPRMSLLYSLTPAWLNHFETVAMVQFQHRVLAYGIVLISLWHSFVLTRGKAGSAARRAVANAGIVLVQAGIGILTLLWVVPLWAALLHQAWALVLLAMATAHAYAVFRARKHAERPTRLP